MRRWARGLSILLAVTLLALALAGSAMAKSGPKLQLKAACSTCNMGDSVRLTVTVRSGGTPYEVRIYQNVGDGWQQATTATLVSHGKYTAYAQATQSGQMQLKAESVNSCGHVTSCSNVVRVKVTGS
jgi:uncharacterized protein (DUF58 family)